MNFVKILVVCICLATTTLYAKHKKKSKKAPSPPVVQQVSSKSSYTVMQSTGQQPAVYHYFEDHNESLKIAMHFLPEDPVIIEAGAYEGKESCAMAAYWPKGHVHCFEPAGTLFERVKSNAASISNISAYQLALADQSGKRVLHLSKEMDDLERVSMSSSLLPPKDCLLYSAAKFEGYEVVQVTTLDAWAKAYQIPKVDMLWLDVQGGQLDALKGAETLLGSVSVILAKLEFVEAFEGQPLYQEVRAWLEEQDFALVGGNFKFPKENVSQWFGYGLFVRNERINEKNVERGIL